MLKTKQYTGPQLIELRKRLRLNQQQFWAEVGVTQSGGSRYESGRKMPKPVTKLIELVHECQLDISTTKACKALAKAAKGIA